MSEHCCECEGFGSVVRSAVDVVTGQGFGGCRTAANAFLEWVFTSSTDPGEKDPADRPVIEFDRDELVAAVMSQDSPADAEVALTSPGARGLSSLAVSNVLRLERRRPRVHPTEWR